MMRARTRAEKTIGLILFAASLGYFALELVFNRQLLDVSSSVRSDPAQMEHLQYFGRAASATGFTLLVLGLMAPFRALRRFMPLMALLAWPGMFYGQKEAVERYIVAPTSVEDRLNARYILMLRSGIEDCIVVPENQPLCDGAEPPVIEKRSTRSILGALFILNPKGVFEGLSFSKDEIIAAMAAKDMWFSTGEYYQTYLQQVADQRAQYEQLLEEKFYRPYAEASDAYQQAYVKIATLYERSKTAGALEKTADGMAAEMEKETQAGWKRYQSAAEVYRRAAQAKEAQTGKYEDLCLRNPAICSKLRGAAQKFLQRGRNEVIAQEDTARARFEDISGYPPDIPSYEAFVSHPKTQGAIREKIGAQIPGYAFPAGWTYDAADFKARIVGLMRDQAKTQSFSAAIALQEGWQRKARENFGRDIPPGLGKEAFLKQLGVDPLPPLSALVMSKEDFQKEYIIPASRKITDETLRKIKDESPGYANHGALEAQGKDYIRALYIPAVALCLSVLIVVTTLAKYLAAGVAALLPRHPFIRPAALAGFLVLAVALPYQWPNPYASGAAYLKYARLAGEKHPAAARLIDWVVHVQPIIYRAGAWLEKSPLT